MNIKDINIVEERAEKFFRDLEEKTNEVIEGFEQRSKCVTDKHAKIMARNANIFWTVLGVVVIGTGAYMIDNKQALASKVNSTEMKEYVLTEDMLKAMEMEFTRTGDTYQVKDSAMMRFYNERFDWQLQNILKKK